MWPLNFFFQYATQRASFDECVSQTLAGGAQYVLDGPGLCLLSRQLIFFYRQSVDAHRLVRIWYIFHALQLQEYWLFHRRYYSQRPNIHLTNCVYLFVHKDMVVPEPGETQQSVCEAVGGPTETDMYVSDQEDLRLLLQVQYLKKQIMHSYF